MAEALRIDLIYSPRHAKRRIRSESAQQGANRPWCHGTVSVQDDNQMAEQSLCDEFGVVGTQCGCLTTALSGLHYPQRNLRMVRCP